MRTWVYIDGFNLYYAIRNSECKSLNLKEFSQVAMPAGTLVEKLKYYTARVSGATDPDQPRRQRIYLNVLRTLPKVEIFFGQFFGKAMWRPLLNLPIGGRAIQHDDGQTTLPPGSHAVSPDLDIGDSRLESLPVGKYGTR